MWVVGGHLTFSSARVGAGGALVAGLLAVVAETLGGGTDLWWVEVLARAEQEEVDL